MKVNTKQRKKATQGFEHIYGKDELANRMFHILTTGKQGIDALVQELGIMMAQAIMDMEPEELSVPEYFLRQRGAYEWAYQPDSIYLGDQKVSVPLQDFGAPEGDNPPCRVTEYYRLRVLSGAGAEIDITAPNGRLCFGIFAALVEFRTGAHC